ncbi:MAG: hypothetical protein ACMUJM_24615 [bacterium]
MNNPIRDFSILVGCILLAVCIFGLPVGYLENYRHFGHPIGPQDVRKAHSFEGESIDYIARNGTKNLDACSSRRCLVLGYLGLWSCVDCGTSY